MCRWLAFCLILICLPNFAQASVYVGSETCRDCHADAWEAWRSSHHFQAMLPASDESVLGDFDGSSQEHHEVRWKMSRDETGFFASYERGEQVSQLPIRYTFGFSPLQQYLAEVDDGRLQALNIAWDSRSEESGGQRWFHLRESLEEDSPFTWNRHFQNWNGRCAECHSTHVEKTFDRETGDYTTTFSEPNVGCESCHGPAREHVTAARMGEFRPLFNAPDTLSWQFKESSIAASQGEASDAHIDMCGGCHARRSVIGEIAPGADFHDQYDLTFLDPGLYHADGQILDEVFVLGSFLQSRMHGAGVTCMNCHDAHSGQVLFDDNRLCAQCHNPVKYDVVSHTLHKPAAPGAACVDCHMPATTYMLVDDRRDHRFGIPDPALTITHDVPNACNGCHEDKTAEWSAAEIGQKNSTDEFALVHFGLRSLDPLSVPRAIRYVNNANEPVLRRATILAALPMTEETIRVALKQMESDETLLRQAAARKLGEAPAIVRQMTLPSLADDSQLVVQREAGRSLVSLAGEVSAEDFALVLPQITTYRNSLEPAADLPSAMTEIARIDLNLGRQDDAKLTLQAALRQEPHYVPALLNLADIYREEGEAESAGKLLEKAVEVAPDSGAANHSYGLYLVRQEKTEEALYFLQQATQRADASPRFAYVYAIALDAGNRTAESVEVLRNASKVWPNQFDLLMLEVLYREKTGLLSGIQSPLRALARLAPQEQQVQQRLQRYGVM